MQEFVVIYLIADFFSRLLITASIFAYGQTSSGKTYTMTGITEFAVADIFDYINKVIYSRCSLLTPAWIMFSRLPLEDCYTYGISVTSAACGERLCFEILSN